jgi:hypothetical protein
MAITPIAVIVAARAARFGIGDVEVSRASHIR